MEICQPSWWVKVSKWAKSKFEMGTASAFHSVNPALKSTSITTPALVASTIQWKSNWKTCLALCQWLIKMSFHNHVGIELFLFFRVLAKTSRLKPKTGDNIEITQKKQKLNRKEITHIKTEKNWYFIQMKQWKVKAFYALTEMCSKKPFIKQRSLKNIQIILVPDMVARAF